MQDNIYGRIVIVVIAIIIICAFWYLYTDINSRIDLITEENTQLIERIDLLDAETKANNAAESDDDKNDNPSSPLYSDLTFSECIFGTAGNYEWLILKKQ